MLRGPGKGPRNLAHGFSRGTEGNQRNSPGGAPEHGPHLRPHLGSRRVLDETTTARSPISVSCRRAVLVLRPREKMRFRRAAIAEETTCQTEPHRHAMRSLKNSAVPPTNFFKRSRRQTANQEEHHRRVFFEDEFVSLLK